MKKKILWTTLILSAAALPLAAEKDFTVQVEQGVPRMVSEGKPIAQRLYMANPMHLPTVSLASDAGVSIYQIVDYNLVWDGQPESAFETFDKYLDSVLAINPEVRVIPRIKLDDREPPFLRKHPECWMRMENGDYLYGFNKSVPIASIAHPRYRAEIRKALLRTIRHLEKKYGDRIAGYHPAYGNGSEWQYWHFGRQDHFSGYDEGTRDAFRAWLKAKYKTDAALANAWNKSGVTFSSAVVPSVKERRGLKGSMMFHDPQVQQNVIDFNFFYNENMAEGMLDAAKAIREAVGKKKLSCAFYGYTFECSAGYRNGPAVSGHNALAKVLESDDIDVLMGPYSYQIGTRALGGGAATHAPTESISNAGKIWLNEDDNITAVAIEDIKRGKFLPDGAGHIERTMEESIKIYRRNLAFNYMRNYAGWWMDLFGRKWQNDVRLWDEMRRFLPLEKKLMAEPQPYRPDIALIIDENSLNYFVSSGEPFRLMVFGTYEVRDRVSRSSASYGQYLLSDVFKNKVESKLDIHCASVALSAKEREILKKRAEKIPTIWLIAPGFIDKDNRKQSLETMQDLTGFKFVRTTTRELRARSNGSGMFWGTPYEYGGFSLGAPAFAVIPEKDDVVLANFADGKAAVVFRPGKDGKAPALFCGTNDLPVCVIRKMAELGGAKIWSKEDLHVHTNGRFAAFTAPEEGAYIIDTGKDGEIRDALSGEVLGKGPELLRRFQRGDTLIVEFEDSAK